MWEVLPEHAAASLFANAFRKKKARERMYEAVQKRYMKVYDANTGYFYFVDTQTRVVALGTAGGDVEGRAVQVVI